MTKNHKPPRHARSRSRGPRRNRHRSSSPSPSRRDDSPPSPRQERVDPLRILKQNINEENMRTSEMIAVEKIVLSSVVGEILEQKLGVAIVEQELANKDILAQFEEARTEVEKAKEEVAALEEAKAAAATEHEAERSRLLRKLEKLHARLAAVERENAALTSEREATADAVEAEKLDAWRIERSIRDLERRHGAKSEEVERLKSELGTKERKIHELQGELAELQADFAVVQRDAGETRAWAYPLAAAAGAAALAATLSFAFSPRRR